MNNKLVVAKDQESWRRKEVGVTKKGQHDGGVRVNEIANSLNCGWVIYTDTSDK